MTLALRIVEQFVYVAVAFWVISHNVPHWLKPGNRLRRAVAAVRNEIAPFMLPLVVVRYLVRVYLEIGNHQYFNGNAVLGFFAGVLLWWTSRNGDDDDDRWRGRGRKALSRVRALASGRLAVEPN